MKKAVMIGAGCIGRGFIGQALADSGYQVCFLEIDPALVAALNRQGGYTVRFCDADGSTSDHAVGPVRALHANSPQATEEIAACDLLATAVGVRSLPQAAATIAAGVALRAKAGGGPLDVLLCENQLHVDQAARPLIYSHLSPDGQAWADANLGLVQPSIGRIVPRPTAETCAAEPLLIVTEPYDELPVDRAAFRGPVPDIKGLVAYSPFDYYILRKLYLVNMAHALCAYLGWRKGYAFIWQAAEDAEIRGALTAALGAIARALGAAYGADRLADAKSALAELPKRFSNRALGDTVLRVGADPLRKLRREDRLVGAALFAIAHGQSAAPFLPGILAALRFDPPGDPAAQRLAALLREQGIGAALTGVMGLSPDDSLYGAVKSAWEETP